MASKKSEKGGKKSTWTWQKTGAVVLGVFFVVIMVVSSLGMGWLSGLVTVKPGDSVIINYTVRDDQGRPVVTTDQNIYASTLQKNQIVLITPPRQLAANATGSGAFTPIDVYIRGDTLKFGFLTQEMDTINREVVGMKEGEQKRISLNLPGDSSYYIPRDSFEEYFGNQTNLTPGMQVPLFLSDKETIPLTNETPSNIYVRIATVLNETADGVTLDYGYSTADIILVRHLSNVRSD